MRPAFVTNEIEHCIYMKQQIKRHQAGSRNISWTEHEPYYFNIAWAYVPLESTSTSKQGKFSKLQNDDKRR